MGIATGVAKRLAAKVESTFGEAAGASGAQEYRRVQSTLNLTKQTFESAEIDPSYMVGDFRHGPRSVNGNINGELSGGTYQSFVEAALRRAATAVSAISSLTLTVADDGDNSSVTRSAGSWISDGVRRGLVIRVTAGLAAGSLNRNLLVLDVVSTTEITVAPLDGGAALAAESAVGSCAVSIPGKYSYVPTTGHIDRSYTIEEWHADISLSRLYTGCKVATMGFRLPATGMSTIEMAFMGQNMALAGSAYFSSPTATSVSGITAAVNGALFSGTTKLALCTGMDINIDGGMSVGQVIGSNITPDVFEGRVRVSGQVTLYLEDDTYLDAFLNESELSLAAALLETSAVDSNFQGIYLPRVKFGAASVDDGEKGLIVTAPFTALRRGTLAGVNDTVMQVQDSLYA